MIGVAQGERKKFNGKCKKLRQNLRGDLGDL